MLEKELMLPRRGIATVGGNRGKGRDEVVEENENSKALGNRSNVNLLQPKPKTLTLNPLSNPKRTSPKPQNSPPHPISQPQSSSTRRTSNAIQSMLSQVNSATTAIAANLSNVPQQHSHHNKNNNYIGSKSPPPNRPPPTQEDINYLSEQHDQYIELILEEEEKLIKQH